MALPTLTDLKTYLRIESSVEDALLTTLLTRARAQLEAWIDCPIALTTLTHVERIDDAWVSIVLPRRYVSSVSIVDSDGVTMPSTDYWVDSSAGIIWAELGVVFTSPRYTITAQYGLVNAQMYSTWEPMLNQCIIDLAADLYQRRTPYASSESAAGTSISWDVSREVSSRVIKDLRLLKLPVML
jgi:uncharacterized phiE125 gp8 family phage protein